MIWQSPQIPRDAPASLGRWLQYLLRDLGNFINWQHWTTFRFDPIDSFDDIPLKLEEGVMVYAKSTIPGGPGEGLNIWDGEKWLRATPVTGYGGIQQTVATGMPNFGGGWTLLPADAGLLTTPHNVVQDHPMDAIALEVAGLWELTINFGFEHNSSNAGRLINLRLLNTSTGTPSSQYQIGTGRNAEHTNATVTLLFEVPAGNIGDLISVQLGGGDSYSNVVLDAFVMQAVLVSEF